MDGSAASLVISLMVMIFLAVRLIAVHDASSHPRWKAGRPADVMGRPGRYVTGASR